MAVLREDRELYAAVSGSFRRALEQVRAAVDELEACGVTVLSPADPRQVDAFGDFVYVASDVLRTVRVLQQRHFAAIARSDLLWVCIPDCTLGSSTTAEIHHANMLGVPVFARDLPNDIYWRQCMTPSNTVTQALDIIRNAPAIDRGLSSGPPDFLLKPDDAADTVIDAAEALRRRLTTTTAHIADDPEVWRLLDVVQRTSSLRSPRGVRG